jgi:hypothetical protein
MSRARHDFSNIFPIKLWHQFPSTPPNNSPFLFVPSLTYPSSILSAPSIPLRSYIPLLSCLLSSYLLSFPLTPFIFLQSILLLIPSLVILSTPPLLSSPLPPFSPLPSPPTEFLVYSGSLSEYLSLLEQRLYSEGLYEIGGRMNPTQLLGYLDAVYGERCVRSLSKIL